MLQNRNRKKEQNNYDFHAAIAAAASERLKK
jgi:hypothetical protein